MKYHLVKELACRLLHPMSNNTPIEKKRLNRDLRVKYKVKIVMFLFGHEFIQRWMKKGEPKQSSHEFYVDLDKNSVEIFKRIKARLPRQSDSEIITMALVCLEQRINRVIRRHTAKRNQVLKTHGPMTRKPDSYV